MQKYISIKKNCGINSIHYSLVFHFLFRITITNRTLKLNLRNQGRKPNHLLLPDLRRKVKRRKIRKETSVHRNLFRHLHLQEMLVRIHPDVHGIMFILGILIKTTHLQSLLWYHAVLENLTVFEYKFGISFIIFLSCEC